MSNRNNLLTLAAVGVAGWAAYKMYSAGDSVTDAITNPFTTTADVFGHLGGDLVDAVDNPAGNMATTTVDMAEKGGDLFAGAFQTTTTAVDDTVDNVTSTVTSTVDNTVDGTVNTATDFGSEAESTWNSVTPNIPQVGSLAGGVTSTADTLTSGANDLASKAENTWNSVTPDVGNLW